MADDRPDGFLWDAELCEALDISLATLKRRIRPEAYAFPLQPLPSIDKRRRWSRAELARYLAGETRNLVMVRSIRKRTA